MIVKCEWITCIHNAENTAYKKDNGSHDSTGSCECPTGEILLIGETECGECGADIEAMICKSYENGGNF